MMKLPKEKFNPKIPFSAQELEKVMCATEVYPKQGIHGNQTGARVRAFVLVFRYTGLRIRDVVLLRRSAIQDGKIFLYQAKTGIPVFIPVPNEVTEALAKIGGVGEFIFWSGSGNVKKCCRRLAKDNEKVVGAFRGSRILAPVQDEPRHRTLEKRGEHRQSCDGARQLREDCRKALSSVHTRAARIHRRSDTEGLETGMSKVVHQSTQATAIDVSDISEIEHDSAGFAQQVLH